MSAKGEQQKWMSDLKRQTGYFLIFRFYLPNMTTAMKAAPDQALDAWGINSDLYGLRIE